MYSGIARAVCVVAVCALLRPDSLCIAADKEGPDYAPGTLVVVDFGGKSIGEVVSKERTGWFKVRSLSALGTERTQTLPPKSLSPAQPGAKYGERLDGKDRGKSRTGSTKATGDDNKGEPKRDFLNPPARTLPPQMPPLNADTAPKPSTFQPPPEFAPGTLVEVRAADTIGEVIGMTPHGLYQVRVKPTASEERVMSIARHSIVVAKPGAKFGDQPENPFAPKPVVAGATKPTPSVVDPVATAAKAALAKRKAELDAEMMSLDRTGIGRGVKPGTLVMFWIDRTIGRIVAEVPPSSYRVQYINIIGAETDEIVNEGRMKLAGKGEPYGFDVDEGKMRQVDAAVSASVAGDKRRKESLARLAAARNAPVITQLFPPRSDAADAIRPLVGSWRIVESSRDGLSNAVVGSQTLVITPTLIQFPSADGRIVNSAEFRVDPTQSPKHLEYQLQLSSQATKRPEVWHGIYELEGDTLRICLGDVDLTSGRPGPRPIEFKTERGMPGEFLLLKRVSD